MDKAMKNNENTRTNNRTSSFLKNVILVLIIVLMIKLIFGPKSFSATAETIKAAFLKTLDTKNMEEVSTEVTGKVIQTETKLTETTVKEVTQKAEKMVTQEVEYEKIGHLTKSKKVLGKNIPLTKDDILFTFKATIYIGVDLEKAEYEVDNEKKVISITLPEAEIIAHEVDDESFEYHTIKDSFLTSSSMDEYMDEVAKLKNKKETELIEEGKIFEETTQQAESILERLLLMNDDTKEFKVEFKNN